MDCWIWNEGGKGRPYIGRRYAYRVIYEAVVGPIPVGLTADHLCANEKCVNPFHIDPVTRAENTKRQWADGRGVSVLADRNAAKTHCPAGHAYDDDNTYLHHGVRGCKACRRLASKRWRERQV